MNEARAPIPTPEPAEDLKPTLRGYLHQEAFFVALGAGILLIARANGPTAQLGCSIYALSLVILFGVSATYHRFNWPPAKRKMMKRLDHSAIFISIAGGATPFTLLAVPAELSPKLTLFVWTVAACGVLQSMLWVHAPKWFKAGLYLAAGWVLLPYLSTMHAAIGDFGVALVLAGGAIYTVGAVIYASKRPALYPKTFGYHELFHVLTIAAASLHFIVIYRLTS